jgi:hypothetical protein
MICEHCKKGGEENTKRHFKLAYKHHCKCKGDCGCQHQTGPGVGSLAKEMAEPMRTQFPLE